MNFIRTLQKSLRTAIIARATPRLMSNKNLGTSGQKPSVTAASKSQKDRNISPKITLMAPNQSLSVTSLEDAQKLAKRRDLHLVQVQEMDTKTKRPVYKLATAAEMLTEEITELKDNSRGPAEKEKFNTQKKSNKTLTIGSRIAEHDLASRLKNISKWLAKQHEVRVFIQCSNSDDLSNGEKIFKVIEQFVKTPEMFGKIVQKHSKGSVIKFNILPVITTTSTSPSTNA